MTDPKPVASLLRQLREQHGSSLRSAAGEIGIAPSHLSRLERGKKGASLQVVSRAANYYGVDPSDLAPPEVPADILQILRDHPEACEELRRRYVE